MMAENSQIVNVNNATIKDLEKLVGVGRAKAEAIYSARMVNGRFDTLEQLLSVPGIGRNILEMNKNVLVCEHSDAQFAVYNSLSNDSSVNDDHLPSDVFHIDSMGSVSCKEEESITCRNTLSSSPVKSASSSRRSSRRLSSSCHQQLESQSSTISLPSVLSKYPTPSTSSAASQLVASVSSQRTPLTHKTCLEQVELLSQPMFKLRQRLHCEDGTSSNVSSIKLASLSQPSKEDSSMEWIYVKDSSDFNTVDVHRISEEQSASSNVETLDDLHIPHSSSSGNYLIAGELGKLRVKESSFSGDSFVSLDANTKEDQCSDEDIEDSMQETSLSHSGGHNLPVRMLVPSVAGSDTPYEEPPELVGAAGGAELDLEHLRSLYVPSVSSSCSTGQILDCKSRNSDSGQEPITIFGKPRLTVSRLFQSKTMKPSNCDDGDENILPDGASEAVLEFAEFRNLQKVSDDGAFGHGILEDTISNSNDHCAEENSHDFMDHSCTLSLGDTSQPGPSNSSASASLLRYYSFEQLESDSEAEQQSNDSDPELLQCDDEKLEDRGNAHGVEDMFVLEESVQHHCKHGKRKFENGGEHRTPLPVVKKSCKAEENCLVAMPATVRRAAPSPAGLHDWLLHFKAWTPGERISALDTLVQACDLTEVRHLHNTILPTFQRDFISWLPKELSLYVLSFLSPRDLLRAAQTCKYWNVLTADNLLWREKCKEVGITNFIEYMDKRRKKGTCSASVSPYKTLFLRHHAVEMNWRWKQLKPFRVLKGHDDHVITCLQFSGNTIVSGSDDNTLKVWSVNSSRCLRTLTGHTGGVWSSQMRDNIIVSGSTDRMLRVWDAETGQCLQTLYGHTSTVRCLHLHDNIVVSGSRDATLRLWDITTGQCHHVLVGHMAAVRCVQYNGRLVVSGAYDFMVKVWNPETEECLHTLQGHTNRVYSLQFDGIHVVSGSLDTTIRVWDVETGACRHTLMGHQSLTSGMELHNNILISGNADSTVKVWDIVTGQCLQTLSGPNKHRSAVTCLQFINKFVVTSSDDGTVKLWDVASGEFVRNLVVLDTGNSGGVVWRIRASDTKLVCAVGSRNGTEETKLLVLDFGVDEADSDASTTL